jgi:lipopolysaccharide export system permease protein
VTRRRFAAGGLLDRYVGTVFLSSYATALLVIVGLVLITDLASNLEGYVEPWKDGGSAPTTLILRYYALNVPFLFLQSAPFVTLAAGVFTVSKLLKYNEIAAGMAAGISARRITAPIFLGGVLAALGSFGLREWMTDTVLPQRDALLYVLKEQRYDRVYENVRLRSLDGSVLRLGELRPAYGSPPRAEVRDLEANLRVGPSIARVQAERAVYVEYEGRPRWRLWGGTWQEVGERKEVRAVDWLEGFDFTPSLALTYHRARNNPLDLSFGEAVELSRRDPDNVVYQTLMQYYLTFSLANVVLLLVGLPLLLRHERGRGMEGLARSLLLCVFYFGADFVCRNLGLQGALDPLYASWLPVLAFGSLGVVLYDSMRT